MYGKNSQVNQSVRDSRLTSTNQDKTLIVLSQIILCVGDKLLIYSHFSIPTRPSSLKLCVGVVKY